MSRQTWWIHTSAVIAGNGYLTPTSPTLDAIGGRIAGPHPRGTLLRASATAITTYPANVESLRTELSPRLREILALTSATVIEPRKHEVYVDLGHLVNAFDDDGGPRPEFTPQTPGRFTTAMDRLTEPVERIDRLLSGASGVIVIIAAVVLTVLGRLGLDQLLGFLK